jgi:glutathione S-transferase
MKLYYKPGACSLSPQIVLCEAGYQYDSEKVDLKTRKTESGKDFWSITDKGAVPTLVLDNGEVLTEGAAIVQYLADQKPESNLAPKNGTLERVRLLEWLNYIATELHNSHSILFGPEAKSAAAQLSVDKIKKAYDYVAGKLKDKKYLMGDQFTVADAYLFTILGWHKAANLDLASWPVLSEYYKRVSERPKVKQAMQAEGLLDTGKAA